MIAGHVEILAPQSSFPIHYKFLPSARMLKSGSPLESEHVLPTQSISATSTITGTTCCSIEQRTTYASLTRDMSDEERRHAKRRLCIWGVKNTEPYTTVVANVSPVYRPRTPDPEDVSISKRTWEKACQQWRRRLKNFKNLVTPCDAEAPESEDDPMRVERLIHA